MPSQSFEIREKFVLLISLFLKHCSENYQQQFLLNRSTNTYLLVSSLTFEVHTDLNGALPKLAIDIISEVNNQMDEKESIIIKGRHSAGMADYTPGDRIPI